MGVKFEAVSSARRQHIEAIRSAWHKSREKVIALGRALLRAKEELAHGEFTAMIQTDLPFGPDSAQQFMRLAKDDRLANPDTYQHLPQSPAALDRLRTLPDEDLTEAIEQGAVHPSMTVKDARHVVQIMQSRKDEPQKQQRRPCPVSEPPEGVASNYSELVWLLRQRRQAAGMSQLELDHTAGLQDGYTSKLEQPDAIYGRRAVYPMFDLWLAGLGVGLMVVPLDETDQTKPNGSRSLKGNTP